MDNAHDNDTYGFSSTYCSPDQTRFNHPSIHLRLSALFDTWRAFILLAYTGNNIALYVWRLFIIGTLGSDILRPVVVTGSIKMGII